MATNNFFPKKSESTPMIVAVRERVDVAWNRDKTFGMRPEQERAVNKTAAYFDSYKSEAGRVPHFLWNCKMRFGKTFTTYQLALKMKWKPMTSVSLFSSSGNRSMSP